MALATVTIEFEQACKRYDTALQAVEAAVPQPTESQVFEVLRARDVLRGIQPDTPEDDTPSMAKLIALDCRLKQQAEVIASVARLDDWRASLQPPADAWWWFFQPTTRLDGWDRFDWVWNGLTAGALALAASFMVGVYQSLAIGGLSWGETFSTIAQGAGLALIGQGALTVSGQQKVKGLLHRMGIPSHFHSEVSCLFAVLLFIMAYSAHTYLPDYFYNTGQAYYRQGLLADAEEKYLQGMQIDADNARFSLALGTVYESLGSLDQALEHYQQALRQGKVEAFNDIGRVYIQRFDPVKKRTDPSLAETYLRMGIQRAKTSQDIDDNTKFQLHRNLGWALAAQQRYTEAATEFRQAIALDQQIPGKQIGGGMAYCFLAQTAVAQGDEVGAQKQWKACLEHARPETINEYKWFMDVQRYQLANCIDTSSIIEGPKPSAAFKDACRGTIQGAWAGNGTSMAALEVLRVKLYDQITQHWDATLPVQQDVSYRVRIGASGAIVGYEPLDQQASAHAHTTPLPALAASASGASQAVRAQFKVVFTPMGAVEVTPWQ